MRSPLLDKYCRDGEWSAERLAPYCKIPYHTLRGILSGQEIPNAAQAIVIRNLIVPPSLWKSIKHFDLFPMVQTYDRRHNNTSIIL